MNENTVMDLTHVSKFYGGIVALNDVDFSLEKGEIHCLVGENGSGKSTLIKVISGVVRPERGAKIVIDGREESSLTPIRSVELGVQVIYQDLSLFPNLSVGENIWINEYFEKDLGLVGRSSLKKKAAEVAKRTRIDLDLSDTVGELNIADRQLVAICRAIAAKAKILIMDEPTSSLSRKEIDNLFAIIWELQKSGITILFVSHKLSEVMEISDRVTILRDGKKIGAFEKKELTGQKITWLMTGKEIYKRRRPSRSFDSAKTLMEVRGLSKKGHYSDISFMLHEGEVLGLVGMKGSGRTELALSLFGMIHPDQGEIIMSNKTVEVKSNKEAILMKISYLPEDRISNGLIMDQAIDKNIAITVIEKLTGWARTIKKWEVQRTVDKWIQTLKIKSAGSKAPVRTLSGGNQQKVVIAKWLATDPKILIMDSPTVGIDISAKDGIYSIVNDLAEAGRGIIIISDEAAEVVSNCDTIILMRNGRIVGRCTPDQVSEETLYDRMIGVGNNE